VAPYLDLGGNFSTKSPRKYAILAPKSPKKFLGRRHCPSQDPSPVERETFPPHISPPWRFTIFCKQKCSVMLRTHISPHLTPLALSAPPLGSRLRRSTLPPPTLTSGSAYETGRPSYVMFRSNVRFSSSIDQIALLSVKSNPRWLLFNPKSLRVVRSILGFVLVGSFGIGGYMREK